MKWIRGLYALTLGFIIVTLVAVIVSIIVTTDSAWFRSLSLPDMPSGLTFELIWLLVYILFAAYIVKLTTMNAPITLYVLTGLQFFGHVLFCVLFFRVHYEWVSLFIIMALTVESFVLITFSMRCDARSVWFLLPYVIWLSYLCSLAYLTVMMN